MKMGYEAAKELKHSSLWETVVNEIDERIRGLAIQLKTISVEELKGIQTHIKALEEIKNLPQDVIEREDAGD